MQSVPFKVKMMGLLQADPLERLRTGSLGWISRQTHYESGAEHNSSRIRTCRRGQPRHLFCLGPSAEQPPSVLQLLFMFPLISLVPYLSVSPPFVESFSSPLLRCLVPIPHSDPLLGIRTCNFSVIPPS